MAAVDPLTLRLYSPRVSMTTELSAALLTTATPPSLPKRAGSPERTPPSVATTFMFRARSRTRLLATGYLLTPPALGREGCRGLLQPQIAEDLEKSLLDVSIRRSGRLGERSRAHVADLARARELGDVGHLCLDGLLDLLDERVAIEGVVRGDREVEDERLPET